jgi:hypothetical protein
MSGLNNLANNIKIWNSLNEKIHDINTNLNKIRDKKSTIETYILEDMKTKNLTDTKLKIDNNHLTYNISYTNPTLSFSTLDFILNNMVTSQEISCKTKELIIEEIDRYKENNKKKTVFLKKKKIKLSKRNKSINKA